MVVSDTLLDMKLHTDSMTRVRRLYCHESPYHLSVFQEAGQNCSAHLLLKLRQSKEKNSLSERVGRKPLRN